MLRGSCRNPDEDLDRFARLVCESLQYRVPRTTADMILVSQMVERADGAHIVAFYATMYPQMQWPMVRISARCLAMPSSLTALNRFIPGEGRSLKVTYDIDAALPDEGGRTQWKLA